MSANIITLPIIKDQRGSLSFLEIYNHVPFKFNNISLITDVKNLFRNEVIKKSIEEEFLIVLSGSLLVKVVNEDIEEIFHLSEPNIGLHILGRVKIVLGDFVPNTILLLLSSNNEEKLTSIGK